MLRTRFSKERHPEPSRMWRLVSETTNLQTGEQVEKLTIADNLPLEKAKELVRLAKAGA